MPPRRSRARCRACAQTSRAASSEVARATSASLSRAGGRSAIACPSSRRLAPCRTTASHTRRRPRGGRDRSVPASASWCHGGDPPRRLPLDHGASADPRAGRGVLPERPPGRSSIRPCPTRASSGSTTAAANRVLLTNRHHYRHSGELVERFGSRSSQPSGLARVHTPTSGSSASTSATRCRAGCRGRGRRDLPRRDRARPRRSPRGRPRRRGGPVSRRQRAARLRARLALRRSRARQGRSAAACRRLLDEHEFDHLLLAHGGAVLGDGRSSSRASSPTIDTNAAKIVLTLQSTSSRVRRPRRAGEGGARPSVQGVRGSDVEARP